MPQCLCNELTTWCYDCSREVCPGAPTLISRNTSRHNYEHAPNCPQVKNPEPEPKDYDFNQTSINILPSSGQNTNIEITPDIPLQPQFPPVYFPQIITPPVIAQTGSSNNSADDSRTPVSRFGRERRAPKEKYEGAIPNATLKAQEKKRGSQGRPTPKPASKEKQEANQPQENRKRTYDKIKDEHEAEDNNNSRQPQKRCKPNSDAKKSALPEKRVPQAPRGATLKQVAFLESFATQKPECTCYKKENPETKQLEDTELTDWADVLFDSADDATEQVKKLIRTGDTAAETEEKKASSSKKAQTCDAFTILSKNGKFMILRTNSDHHQSTDDLNTGKKYLRPKKEPLLPDGKIACRFYFYKSCAGCHEEPKAALANNLIAIKPETKFDDLDEKKVLTQYDPHGLGSPGVQLRKHAQEKKHSRVLVVDKIQPNGMKSQDGCTLHHSEMESYYFAKRHGWEIIEIIIDRDCCPVCGATLKRIAPEVHEGIRFYHQLLEEKKEEKKVKTKRQVSFSQNAEDEEIPIKEEYFDMLDPEQQTSVIETPHDYTGFDFEANQTGEEEFDFGVTQTDQKPPKKKKIPVEKKTPVIETPPPFDNTVYNFEGPTINTDVDFEMEVMEQNTSTTPTQNTSTTPTSNAMNEDKGEDEF